MALVASQPRLGLSDSEYELTSRIACVELAVEVAAVPRTVLEGLVAVGDGEDRLVVAALEGVPQLRVPARVPEAEQDEGAPERARPGSRRPDPEDLLVASLAHRPPHGQATARQRQAPEDARRERAQFTNSASLPGVS